MSRTTADDLETRIARGLVVQEHGREGVDLLDYLQHTSRADPEVVTA